MDVINALELGGLFPSGEAEQPRYVPDEADYALAADATEADFAAAVRQCSNDEAIHVHPEATIQLQTREYEIAGDLISAGATFIQTAKRWGGWGTWQMKFTGGNQSIIGIRSQGPLSDGTYGDDDTTGGFQDGDKAESWLCAGLVSYAKGNTFYRCDVRGWTHANFLIRAAKNRVLDSRTAGARFDHLGYGISISHDTDLWDDRTVVAGCYTSDCRHHIKHGGRGTMSEIAHCVVGERAPFGHRLDVHREGGKRTVWTNLTIHGPPENTAPKESGPDETFNFRGTPLEYHMVRRTAFAWDGAEPPETSNDGPEATITQTNQGLTERYTWAENRGGDIDEDEYKDKDLPDEDENGNPTYLPENTDGIKGFDRVFWKLRGNKWGYYPVDHPDDNAGAMWYREDGTDPLAGEWRVEDGESTTPKEEFISDMEKFVDQDPFLSDLGGTK